MRRCTSLAALLLLSIAIPAQAETPGDLRVGLLQHQPPASLQVSADGPWRLSAGGRSLALPAGRTVTLLAQGRRVQVMLNGRPVASGMRLMLEGRSPWTLAAPQAAPRRYEGRLSLYAFAGRLRPVLALPREHYVASVVGDEMPADWPREALVAQALAARSYAAAGRGRHGSQGFDFCDLTHCQLFRGLASRDARVTEAVTATRDRGLLWHGGPVGALWHSTCGGQRAANETVFGGAPRPYLPAGADRDAKGRLWCAASPHARPWRVTYETAALTGALRRAAVLGPAENLRGLEVADRDRAGLALTVRVTGDRPRALPGYSFWMALGPHFGWGEIKSPFFGIEPSGTGYMISGRGLGHGVGMCQWGARGRALAGQSAEAIVGAYFPGTRIGALGR